MPKCHQKLILNSQLAQSYPEGGIMVALASQDSIFQVCYDSEVNAFVAIENEKKKNNK